MDETQLIFYSHSFPPYYPMFSAKILACLVDNSSYMATHQQNINPSKTELLFITTASSTYQDLAIYLDNLISPDLILG